VSIEAETRREIILQLLQEQNKIKVSQLAHMFAISTETARRDLEALEQEGIVKRVYGGAILQGYTKEELPFWQKEQQNYLAKQGIGKKAATLINDHETIIIDVGTTTIELAKNIRNVKEVTIITNSLTAANALSISLAQGYFSGEIILLPGTINPAQQSIRGSLTEKLLENFYVDKAFISIGGITINEGITDYDIEEALVSRKMIKQAKQAIVLTDHSKIGVKNFYLISKLNEIDMVISDTLPPKAWEQQLTTLGIEWVSTNTEENK